MIDAREDPFESLLYEERITPEQVAEYKPAFHRKFLEDRLRTDDSWTHKSVDEVWEVREQCIRALEKYA